MPVVPPLFIGREELVQRLLASLLLGRTRAAVRAIVGLGGMGKTTLAAAVGRAARPSVDVLGWVRAEGPQVLVDDLAEMAPALGVGAVPGDLESTARAVVRALESTSLAWLVVFDNAPDQRAIERWLPHEGKGTVLVTSRRGVFSLATEVVQVDPLSNHDAGEFLRRRVSATNTLAAEEDIDPVLERLGGLPLALEQAAAWVAQVPNRRFAMFAELFDDAAREPFPESTRPAGYDHTVTTTWRVSIKAAEAEAPLARRTLELLSFLAATDTPCGWLRSFHDDDYFSAEEPQAVRLALDSLHAYSLASISSDDAIDVHRVVQAVTRRTAPVVAVRAAVRCVFRQLPDEDVRAIEHRRPMARLIPHIVRLSETAAAAPPENATHVEETGMLRELLMGVAWYQCDLGTATLAVQSASLAYKLALQHGDKSDLNTLRARDLLASAYRRAGRLPKALALYRENLKECLGQHPRAYEAALVFRNQLAEALQENGDLPEAIALFEENVSAGMQFEEHEAASSRQAKLLGLFERRNNLAGAYDADGQAERARDLLAATLDDLLRTGNKDRKLTLYCRNNLAKACLSCGEFDRAIRYYEENLAEHERLLGPDDSAMLFCRMALAQAYVATGRAVPQAVSMLASSLEGHVGVFGAFDRRTLKCRIALGTAYRTAGDLDRAIDVHEEALADSEDALGPGDLDTAGARHEVARTYAAAGSPEKAIPLYEAALAVLRQRLGPHHPGVTSIQRDLDAALAHPTG